MFQRRITREEAADASADRAIRFAGSPARRSVAFPCGHLGPLGPKYQQLVTVIEMVPVDAFLPRWGRGRGRPPYDRAPFARAFVAKAVFNFPTTAC